MAIAKIFSAELEKALKALRGFYQMVDNAKQPSASWNSQQENLENDVLKNVENCVREFLEPILNQIRTSVMISADYDPNKRLKVESLRIADSNNVPAVPPAQPAPSVQPPQKGFMGLRSIRGTHGPATGLCVYVNGSSIIQEATAAQTLASAIIYAMKLKGSKMIYDYHMPHAGQYLIDRRPHPTYGGSDYKLIDGFFVNTHGDTNSKKRQLDEISDHFGLHWIVKIVK